MLRYGDTSAQVCAIIPWEDVHALVASHLIALDKCPGVIPIGIGETLRSIVGKTICLATHIDVVSISFVPAFLLVLRELFVP